MRRPLKRPDEIFEPDQRSKSFVRIGATGQRAKTFDDHYADICAIRLSDEAPEKIWDEFETVRNLYLYSWHVYDFTVPAVMYAHTIVEKALKEKCARNGVSIENARGLKKLLRLAIDQGWLKNSAFPFALEWMANEIVAAPDGKGPPHFRSTPRYSSDATDYCEQIASSLPKIRNMDAHGEAGLDFPSGALRSIEICACIISALFPPPSL